MVDRGLMGWLFGKKAEKEAARKEEYFVLRDIVNTWTGGVDQYGTPEDKAYFLMPERKLKDFVFKYHISEWKQAYKAEVQDCDDFAIVAKADIVKGQQDAGLDAPIPFGIFIYERKGGGLHAINFAIDDKSKVWLYEPQGKKWSDTLPKDISRVIEVRF